MKALLKNYRQSPRKVRLVADSVRGKSVKEAVQVLSFMPKRAAKAVKKVILSATANAGDKGNSNLKISKITVDDGFTIKRFKPRSRGMANPIRRRTSNIVVELNEQTK